MRSHALEAHWTSWSGASTEVLHLGWENDGWTADGDVRGPDVHYVIRLDAEWNTRQFLLFRDLDEPDLWLVRGDANRWREMNGADRPDLDGCTDFELVCTPFTKSVPIRRHASLPIGERVEIKVARVDVEKLLVEPTLHHFVRAGETQWRVSPAECSGTGQHTMAAADVRVDHHGLVLDYPGAFRRTR